MAGERKRAILICDDKVLRAGVVDIPLLCLESQEAEKWGSAYALNHGAQSAVAGKQSIPKGLGSNLRTQTGSLRSQESVLRSMSSDSRQHLKRNIFGTSHARHFDSFLFFST